MNSRADSSGNISSELGLDRRTERFIRANVITVRQVGDRGPNSDVRAESQHLAQGSTYRVTGEGASRERYEVAETVTVDRRYGPLRSLGGPVVLVGSLLGLIVVGLGRRRGVFELTDQEREWLTYRFDWVEFDEWIHAVQLPPEAHDLPRARADSLATLVDFAIDTDCAAVEPPESDGLYVVHDGYLYTYTTPLPPDWTGAESGSDSESASTTLAERPEEADTEAGTGAGTD